MPGDIHSHKCIYLSVHRYVYTHKDVWNQNYVYLMLIMYISGSVILNFLLFFFYILVKILIISIYHLYKNHNIIILKNILIKEKGKRKNQRRSVTKLDQKSPGLQVLVQVNHFVYLGLHSSEHKATISSYPREGSIPTHLHF